MLSESGLSGSDTSSVNVNHIVEIKDQTDFSGNFIYSSIELITGRSIVSTQTRTEILEAIRIAENTYVYSTTQHG